MKNLTFLFLILLNNNVIFSMENESKNAVIRHRDVNGQSWRVDKEIQFNSEKNVAKIIRHKNSFRSVCFDPTGTKIIAFPWHADCFACTWNRAGEKLENLDFDALEEFYEDNSEWANEFFNSGHFPFVRAYEGNDAELLTKEFGWMPMVCFNEKQTFVVPKFRVYGGLNVYAWNPAEQKRLFTLKHTDIIHSVDFNPQGIEIITASWDGTVRLWNKKNGKELLCITYPTRVMSASFNSTGTEIVVATDDGKIQVLVKETLQ